jgi:hypothetical protein
MMTMQLRGFILFLYLTSSRMDTAVIANGTAGSDLRVYRHEVTTDNVLRITGFCALSIVRYSKKPKT